MKHTSTIQRHRQMDIYTCQLFQDKFQNENRGNLAIRHTHTPGPLKILFTDTRHTQT